MIHSTHKYSLTVNKKKNSVEARKKRFLQTSLQGSPRLPSASFPKNGETRQKTLSHLLVCYANTPRDTTGGAAETEMQEKEQENTEQTKWRMLHLLPLTSFVWKQFGGSVF